MVVVVDVVDPSSSQPNPGGCRLVDFAILVNHKPDARPDLTLVRTHALIPTLGPTYLNSTNHRYPQEIVPIMDLVVHQEFLQQRGDPVADEAAMGGHRIQVCVHHIAVSPVPSRVAR